MQVTARRKPSSPMAHSSLSRSGLFHPHSPRTLSHTQACSLWTRAPQSAWSRTPRPSRVTGRLIGAVGFRKRCAQLSRGEVGQLADSQEECGGDGVKTGPEIHHSRASRPGNHCACQEGRLFSPHSRHPQLPFLPAPRGHLRPPSSRGQCPQAQPELFISISHTRVEPRGSYGKTGSGWPR